MASTASSRSTRSQEGYQRPGWLTSHAFDLAIRVITRLGVSVAGSRILEAHRRTTRKPRRTPVNLLPGDSRELLAKRAAWDRYRDALNALDERRAAFSSSPSDLTAAEVIWAGMELEDAIAVAGEFQVYNLPWSLT